MVVPGDGSQAFRDVLNNVVNRSISGGILPPNVVLLSAAAQQLLSRIPLTLENLKATFRCIALLYELDPSSATQIFVSFIKVYPTSPPLERSIIIEAIRTSNLSLYLIYLWLGIAEKECLHLGTPSPPRSLIMAIFYGGDFIKQKSLTSIILGMGKNNHYNLGIASTGEVSKPRLVPVGAEIIKASLSTSHSLLLTSDGRVYAMGRCEGYRTGLPRNEFAASPQLVPLPKGTIIVDLAAGEGYSLFLTRKSLYACGLNTDGRLGLGRDAGPFQLQKIPLPFLKELILDEVVTTEKFTLITTSSVGSFLLAGTSFGKRILSKSFELYEDYDPEWNDILVPCSTQLEVSPRISTKPHCGIITGQDVNLKMNNESYTIRFVLFNKGLRYRFAHSTYIGEVLYAIDGILFGLDVAEFSVNSKGSVFLRAALDTGVTRRVYSIYRGQVMIWPKEDSSFETAKSTRKKEINMSVFAIVFLLQPIANTSYATSLSVSPDGDNAIFVIGANEEQNSGKLRNWAGQRLIAEPNKDVPFDARICLGGRSWQVMSSVLALRVPESYKFLNGKIMHMEKVFHDIPKSGKREDWCLEVSQMVAQYVREGVATWNPDVWEPESPAIDFVKKALSVLGLKAVGPRPSFGKTLRPLVPIVKGASAQANCLLQCVDEDGKMDEISTNRQLLELHSYYFVLAGKHEGKEIFVVRESKAIVEKVLEAMASPDSLIQCTRDELCRMLIFCDAYAMDSLIDDIIRAFFINATASCLSDLSRLYGWSYYSQNFIIRELIARPDLLFLYTKSEEIDQGMAKRACEAIEAGSTRRSGVTTENPLMIGQAIWHSYAHVYSDRTQVDEERLLFTALSFSAIQPYFTRQAISSCLHDQEIHKYTFHQLKTFHNTANPIYKEFSIGGEKYGLTALDREEFDLMDALVESLGDFTFEPEKNTPSSSKRRRRRTDTERQKEALDTSITEVAEEAVDEVEKLKNTPKNKSPTPEVSSTQISKPMAIVQPSFSTLYTPEQSPSTSRLNENIFPALGATPTSTSKTGKKLPASFAKFRPLPEPAKEKPKESVAPWAHLATQSPSSQSTSLAESSKIVTEKPEPSKAQPIPRARNESLNTNSRSYASPTSPHDSFMAIMREEQQLQDERYRRTHRPLAFVDMEERAIMELKQLYLQSFGDEVIIDVIREDALTAAPEWRRRM